VTLADPPPGRSFRLVLATSFASFCAFYAPQPLLPTFALEFGVAPARSALLLTVCFVALAIAPLLYGAVLQRFSAQRLLLFSTAALGLLQLVFASAPDFTTLLGSRVLQGLLLPAIFTAAVTYCSRARDPAAIARRVAAYIGTTILGGLCGRLIGGGLSDAIGWRATFACIGVLLLACAFGLTRAARDQSVPGSGRSLSASLAILATPVFAAGYALIFLVFFTFSGLLTVLPFRLVALDADIAAGTISLVYLGYLVGVLIAFDIARIGRLAGSAERAMGVALVVFAAGLALSAWPQVPVLIAAGFLTSAGMFTVHSTLSGNLNARLPAQSSLVNGLYIAIYYSAGALGSVLPLALFQQLGWQALLLVLIGTCATAALPLWWLARQSRAAGDTTG